MVSTVSNFVSLSPRILARLQAGELTHQQTDAFLDFLEEVNREFMQHRIIQQNPYCEWFATGQASDAELRHFIQQFSVFSNWFLKAALLRVMNAPNLEQHRASREILLNELGVIYRKPNPNDKNDQQLNDEEKDRQGDPELVGTEGTVDGGTYRFRANHFEWMVGVGESIGMKFEDLGKRHHGRPKTLFFVDELARLYGNEDAQIAEGASFAVENWAAAGFWQQIEDGLLRLKQTRYPQLRLAFFTWHNRVEAQHAGHTMEELEEVFFREDFDREKFFHGGREVLEAVAAFWDGLQDDKVTRFRDDKVQG